MMDGRGIGLDSPHPLLHQVPVVVEGLGQVLQGRGLDPGGEEQQEGALECGVGQQLVAERRPAGLEGDRRAHLVEHLDPGRQAGLDRVLGEQALGEGVQRADGGAVELFEGQPAARPASPSGSASAAFSSAARMRSRSSAPAFSVKVMAAMRRSSACPLRHQGQDPVDQGRGLARPGAGLDEEGGVEVLGDPLGAPPDPGAGRRVSNASCSVIDQLLRLACRISMSSGG